MGIFNRSKNHDQTPANSSNSSWNSLNSTPEVQKQQARSFGSKILNLFSKESSSQATGNQNRESAAEHIQRQRDKLIAAYYHGHQVFGQPRADISEQERLRFQEELYNDQISDQEQSQLLQGIASPARQGRPEDYDRVFNKVNDQHSRMIIAQFCNLGDRNQVQSSDLASFYAQYPTPIEFIPRMETLLQDLLKAGNSELKVSEYYNDAQEFRKSIYGKREEYYQALQIEKDTALHRHLAQKGEIERARQKSAAEQPQVAFLHSSDEEDIGYYPPEMRMDHYEDEDI